MVLKRKRSESELSFGSAFSSPQGPQTFDFATSSPVGFPASRGLFSPSSRSSTPSHGRTMKRFRDNRPSEAEVHQRTLNLLYSAQQQCQQHQQVAREIEHSPPGSVAIVTAPCNPANHYQRSTYQRSLHSFWQLPSSPVPILEGTPSPHISPSDLGVATSCEDCGVGFGDGDDAMMDVDDVVDGDRSCGACGKMVCFSCSVSNLGENRRCLVCAGRRTGVDRNDWKAPGVLQIAQMSSRSGHSHTRTREASHAGSWYEDRPAKLASELDSYLSKVPDTIDGANLPVPGARVIIAPHAGYSYSGPCAAWAYKALDLSGAKRVFLLGPSHKYYTETCALSTFSKYETPFGDLTVDTALCDELRETGDFSNIPVNREVQEHCLEMHLPYLWKRLEQTFGGDSDRFPPIVPIIVGVLNEAEEKTYGEVLAPYLKDPGNAFIISSDFCHWGSNYSYAPQYIDGKLQNPHGHTPIACDLSHIDLGFGVEQSSDVSPPPLHEIIKKLDEMAMDAVESGTHGKFHKLISKTKNTVCGSHPIGVVMSALEILSEEGLADGKGKFKFIQYQRSGLVIDKKDYSVSYASAYAVL
ncbi:Memo-like domain containing protein [Rhypophila decipiens]